MTLGAGGARVLALTALTACGSEAVPGSGFGALPGSDVGRGDARGHRRSLADGFALGVNYPWRNYGTDFGESAWGHLGVSDGGRSSAVTADFEEMASRGIAVARWFVFTDGRSGFEVDGAGAPLAVQARVLDDLDTALAIAEQTGVSILFVLFDYLLATPAQVVDGVQTGGRAHWITDAAARARLLEALAPVLARYGDHPAVFGWDVINEPEWVMALPNTGGAVAPADMQGFVGDLTDLLHRVTRQEVTLGSGSRGWLNLWTDAGLDFLQLHHYDWLEARHPLGEPCDGIGAEVPIIVGEFPTDTTVRSVTEHLDLIWSAGYAGALAWSYRGGDDFSDFDTRAAAFAAWAAAQRPPAAVCP